MKGSLPRPFSPTNAKRDREEMARMAERGDASLRTQGARTVQFIGYTNEELRAALQGTAETLENADTQIREAQVASDAARVELEAALTESDAAQAQLALDMTELQGTTLPALNQELTAAQGRLDTAEGEISEAFGQLGTVDSRIDTAKTQALTDAAADAKSKADAAAAEAKRQLDLAVTSGASLVINGGFEADDIWPTHSLQAYDTAEKRSGSRSMKLTPTGGNLWPTSGWFEGATGRTYRIEYWIKRTGTTSVTNGVGAVFQAKTVAGGTATISTLPSPALSSLDIPTDSYRKVTIDYTISTADTVQIRVAPWVKQASGNTYWVDDVVAYDITDAKAAEAAAATLATQAKEAAISAAATTAQQKADTAKSEAITAAAQDAQTKADAVRVIADKAMAATVRAYRRPGSDAVGIISASTGAASTLTPVASDGAPGGYALQKTGSATSGLNFYDKSGMQDFNPELLYRITFKVRATTDATNGNKVLYAGFIGFKADGTTAVSTSGANSWSSCHYFAASGLSVKVADGWRTFVGHFKGYGATAAEGTNRSDPLAPGKVHPAVRKFMPMAFLDYSGGDGVWELGSVEIDVIPPEAVTALTEARAADDLAGQAHSLAGSANGTAQAALNAATHTGKNLFDTTPPAGTAPYGTVWMQKGTGDVIIGQWQQTGGSAPDPVTGLGGTDGSTWTRRDVGSEMVANLDVGKLTANTAVVNEAVAQKIAASTAAFQKADIGNLTVTGTSKLEDLVAQQVAADSGKFISLAVSQLTAGTASMGVGVIDKLYSEVVNSRKIRTDQLVVSGPNLVPDPFFLDSAQNTYRLGSTGTYTLENDDQSIGKTIRNNEHLAAGTYRSLNLHSDVIGMIQVTPGAKYTIQMPYRLRGNVVSGQKSEMRFAMYHHRPDGSYLRYVGVGSYVTVVGTGATWAVHVSPEYTMPNDVAYIRLQVQFNNAGYDSYFEFKQPKMHAMADGTIIATNSVMAPHIVASEEMSAKLGSFLKVQAGMLETELALISKIIAGPKTGTHVELTPDGFRAFAEDPNGGAPREAVRLGVASTRDYLTMTDGNGEPVASIDEIGKISGDQVHANKELWYKGRELTDVLRDSAGTLRGYGDFYSGVANISAEYGIFDTRILVQPGRAYKVTISGNTTSSNGTGGVLHIFRAASGGGAPMLSSGEIKRFEQSYSTALPTPIGQSFLWYPTVTVPTVMRVLWSLNKYGGGTVSWNGGEMFFEDIGAQMKTAGTANNGGGTTVTPVQEYTQRWEATGIRNWKNDGGSIDTFDDSHMYQGLSPAAQGNLKSLAIFGNGSLGQTITGALGGATVNWIRVYFDFRHWYYNAGGTARVGYHAASTLPASFGSAGVKITSGGWPKPGARWLDVASADFAGFKSGTFKGVTLEGDSTLNTYGYSNPPTIEINYTK